MFVFFTFVIVEVKALQGYLLYVYLTRNKYSMSMSIPAPATDSGVSQMLDENRRGSQLSCNLAFCIHFKDKPSSKFV